MGAQNSKQAGAPRSVSRSSAYDLVSTNDKTQFDLFGGLARQRQLDAAIDDLSERYGAHIVHRGNDLAPPSRARLAGTLDFLDDDSGD